MSNNSNTAEVSELVFELANDAPQKPALKLVKCSDDAEAPQAADQYATRAPAPAAQPKPAIDIYANAGKSIARLTNTLYSASTPGTKLEPLNLTEHGFSLRFVRLFGDTVRYNATQKSWMSWDAKRWHKDEKGDVLQKMTLTAKFMQQDEAAYNFEDSKEIREAGLKLEKHATAKSALMYAQTHPAVATQEADYDTQQLHFNCASGIIDLATGTVQPHDPSALHSQFSPVELAEEGTQCPRWMKFLDEITGGNAELAQYLQTLTGYFLSGDTRRQEFYVFHGDGSNGKSTFIETIAKVLGDYAINADRKTFYVKYQGGGIPNDIAMLRKSRFITCMEGEEGDQIDEGLIKSFTGGDSITARFLHGEFFQFKPVGKVILVSNYKPIIKGGGHGIWRRVRLVPFLVKFSKEQLDPLLTKKLEAELPAILRWAVEGAKRWITEGIQEPKCVMEAVEAYKAELDYVQQFIDERCEVAEESTCTALELHAAFEQWMREQGLRFNYGGVKGLKQKVMAKGFDCKRTKTGMQWQGIQPDADKVQAGVSESSINTIMF